MGRGDKKTFHGKLFKHSHGKVRPGRLAKKNSNTPGGKSKPKQ